MHSGFKGTRLGLRTLTLDDSTITYEVSFLSEEGVVHGMTRHRIPAEADPNIKAKMDELADLLLRKAAAIHFTSPAGTGAGELATQGGAHGGIAELLEDPSTPPDEPGRTQG